jgi:hypothetical protein
MQYAKFITTLGVIALLAACGGGGSPQPQITTCCQTTVCSLNGKAWYDEYCGLISPTTKVATIIGHPTPTGLICTADKALYACK